MRADIVTREDPATSADTRVLVEHFFRHEYGRLTASLVRRFGVGRLQEVEDAVQSSLAMALRSWALRGIPKNPSAWLTRVAQNQILDQLRHEAMAQRTQPMVGGANSAEPDLVAFAGEIADDELRMLFVCCDERLASKTQRVLSLKLLCGFGTREIAARLFLSDANVQKLISRGRRQLAQLWQEDQEADWSEPPAARLALRLSAVQRVIYLLFNEGYSSLRDDQVIRRDLCEEALRLAKLLTSQSVGDVPESWALLALLHFHIARLDARLDKNGGLLLLEQQDRRSWDKRHISTGLLCLARSGSGDNFSRYHVEAAVLAEHCLAPSFEQTRWAEIVELYEMLERAEPSPLHTLNRAIALAEWQGPERGLQVLEAMAPPTWLARYYLWDATLGELLRRTGQHERAIKAIEQAIERTPTEAERKIFRARLKRCRNQDAAR